MWLALWPWALRYKCGTDNLCVCQTKCLSDKAMVITILPNSHSIVTRVTFYTTFWRVKIRYFKTLFCRPVYFPYFNQGIDHPHNYTEIFDVKSVLIEIFHILCCDWCDATLFVVANLVILHWVFVRKYLPRLHQILWNSFWDIRQ